MVAAHVEDSDTPMGGKDVVIELDEAEYGRKRKGVHGKCADPKVDIWGCLDRNTGRVILRAFEKLNTDASARRLKGPASKDEVLPFVEEWVRKNSIICSDRLSAYRNNLEGMGYRWHGINHSTGDFNREQEVVVRRKRKILDVHSQSIDSIWRHIKQWMSKRAFHSMNYPFFVLEWQWRHNNQNADRFQLLLDIVAVSNF